MSQLRPAVSQALAAESLRSGGHSLLGWHQSHPSFLHHSSDEEWTNEWLTDEGFVRSAVSQALAAESLRSGGHSLLGWHHSHPSFPPSPSALDLRTQAALQQALERRAPFLAIVTSQAQPRGRMASQYRWVCRHRQPQFFLFGTYVPTDEYGPTLRLTTSVGEESAFNPLTPTASPSCIIALRTDIGPSGV